MKEYYKRHKDKRQKIKDPRKSTPGRGKGWVIKKNIYYNYLNMNKLSDIGLIGLAVMGENLVLNMESKGFQVTVYNRTTQKVDDFLAGRAKG